jgi:tetratricopeptide (TPR) repeat protein
MMSDRRVAFLKDAFANYKPTHDENDQKVFEEAHKLQNAYHKLIEQYNGGHHEELVDGFTKLPEDYQKVMCMQVIRLDAASALHNAKTEKVLKEYHKSYPDAANYELYMIIQYLAKGQFDKALTSVNALDRDIGSDPYLDIVRANVCKDKKDVSGTFRYAQRALDGDPKLLRGYQLLLIVSLHQRRYADTAKALAGLQKYYPKLVPNVESEAEYAGFLKSPQYKTWAKSRPKKA